MAKYTWTGGGDGSSWNDPNNWNNVTTGDNPAKSAPGAGDDTSVGGPTINDNGAAHQVDASGLTIKGSLSAVLYNDHGHTDVADGGSLDVSMMLDEEGSLTVEGALTASGFKAGSGSVDIKNGTFTVTNVASITGGASITIEGGATAKISSNAATAASLNVGGGSSITVKGSGTQLTTGTGGVNLGLNGSGSLDIEGGATVKSSQDQPTRFTAFALGVDSAGSGSVTVNGKGSTFDVGPGELQVGTLGRGNLTISDGGTVSVSQFGLGIADFSGSTGNVEVTGQGSTLDSASWITVGNAGTGSLTIENHGTVEADILNSGVEASSTGSKLSIGSSGTLTVNDADLGYADGSDVTATVDGSGSLWTINGFITVGDGGDATLTIQGQGEVDADSILVARQATSLAEIDVNGQGSVLNANDSMEIGYLGSGRASIADGGVIDASAGNVTFASQYGSTGALTITGDDSSMTAAALVFGDSGTATGTIEDGGALSVNGDLLLGYGDSGWGSLTVAAGDLTIDGNLTIGGAGTGVLVSQGGSITVLGNAIIIGDQASGTGTFTINTADASLDFSGTITVGAAGNGAMFVQLGADITVDTVVVADQTGSIGSLTVDSASLQTADLIIGSSGQGTLDVKNGASLISTGGGKIADLVAGVISSATVETGGIWALDGDLTVGGSGIGTLSVNEATVSTLSNVTIGDLAVSSGLVTVTGAVTDSEAGTSPASLGWGGVLTVGNDGYGTLDIEDGALVGPIPGGAGEIDIAAHDGSTGVITVDGIDSLLNAGDLFVGGTFWGPGGDGTLTAQQGGTVAVTDTVTLWTGNVDVSDGGLLVIGTIPSDSEPVADGTVLVRADGLLTGDGTITGDVIDDGTIDAEHGTLKIDGAVSGSGVIDIGAQAIAEIDGPVAAGTAVDFLTDDGTLVLDQPSNFAGTIHGLQLGDTIDLAGVDFCYGASAQLLDGNILEIVTGGASPSTYDLQLDPSQSFSTESFKLSCDNNGGIDINLNAGLSMNIVYDSTVDDAPDALRDAIDKVVNLYQAEFANPDTINIHIGWGFVGADPVAADTNATTYTAPGPTAYTYTQIYNALIAGASSDVQRQAYLTLPDPAAPGNPFANDIFANGIANAQALGLVGNNSAGIDGWVGFNDNRAWSFAGSGTTAGFFDFIGTAEHEISHLMGRITRLGGLTVFPTADGTIVGYTSANSPMDLFRYAGPGTFDHAPATQSFNSNVYPTGYFSIDAGATSLGTFNNFLPDGDLSSWLREGAPLPNDAYSFVARGGPAPLSQTDFALMNVIGWNTATSPGPLPATAFFNAEVTTGATLDVTVSAFSTLIDHGGSVIVEPGAVLWGSTIDNGGTVELRAGASAQDGFYFTDTGNLLRIDGLTMPTVTIAGFVDTPKYGDVIDLADIGYDAGGHVDLLANGVLRITENSQIYDINLDPTESYEFFHLSPDGAGGTLITQSNVACYCRGTLIATSSGELPAESLKIGDKVVTASGDARPIKWIGKRSYGGRFLLGQKHILPVCIKAGALDENTPRRDLWISPHHAMYLEGVLIEARDLVNNINVVQPEDTAKVEYFHIELETHDVIIAEGALSETFVDDDSRGMFHNAREYYALYPDEAAGSALYYAPRCADGYEVQAARRKIARRAGLCEEANDDSVGKLRGYVDVINSTRIEGWAQNEQHPEAPVCLDILVDGECIDQVLANKYRADLSRAGLGSGNHSFSYVASSGRPIRPGFVEIRRSLDGTPLAASAQCRNPRASTASGTGRAAIMKRAWAISRETSSSGVTESHKQRFAACLRQAWAETGKSTGTVGGRDAERSVSLAA